MPEGPGRYKSVMYRQARQLDLYAQVLDLALRFEPKAATRAEDVKWFRAKMSKLKEGIDKLENDNG